MPTVWGEMIDGRTIRVYGKYQDALAKIGPGKRLRLKVDKDRNGKFNSFYHVMLDLCVKAANRGPVETSIDLLKKWVKENTGRYRIVKLPSGREVIDYDSTDFASMGEGEFHQFAQDTAILIRDKFAPYISDSDEWREIETMITQLAGVDA